uniref:ATP synthase F1 subunit 4 n=1 Tax=Symphyocladiella dendroidea TaxID=2506487 RepID=UPI0022FDB098|nr:ATP synthase F1 subunit 4 [Symphyocladiella dendroidea]WAX04023.1 ATP synthase F1 subunit 4 [Symphyocladiella dendroidea]
MRFLFVFIILFVFILTNKFFLLNEEFLILLNFIGFCFVVYEQLGMMLSLRFAKKSLVIKNSLLSSINSISYKLNSKKTLNNKIINFFEKLTFLKKYYIKFSFTFLTQFIIYLNINEKANFLSKLIYLKQLETMYFKLIIILLFKKIKIINLLTNFFGNKLQLKRFQTLNLINKLDLIKKI